MSNPDDAATQTFAQKVDTAIKTMTVDEKGNAQLPDKDTDYSEEMRYAITTEKRRRDTLSSYTKGQQKLAQVTTERDAFKNKLTDTAAPAINLAQQKELDELKFTDPDAWKAKLEGYVLDAKSTLNTELDDVATRAHKQSELQVRELILADYYEANPGFSLVDDDIPPRISKKLETGAISFKEFLSEVHTYIKTPKVLAKQDFTAEPSLSALAGGSKPLDTAVTKSIEQSYAKTDIF